MNETDAREACKNFGARWAVVKVTDGALVCTLNGLSWSSNCNKCSADWRMIVWRDGANEYPKDNSNYKNLKLSTKAGKYYGGHDPCIHGNNYPICGDWANNSTSGKYAVQCTLKVSSLKK